MSILHKNAVNLTKPAAIANIPNPLPITGKGIDTLDPNTNMPKGHMFNIGTMNIPNAFPVTSVIDANFAVAGLYPNAANGYANGINLHRGGPTVSTFEGIYIKPQSGKVMYLDRINIHCIVGTDGIFDTDFDSSDYLEFSHMGSAYCRAYNLTHLFGMCENVTTQTDYQTVGDTYKIGTMVSRPPGRFTDADYFGIKSGSETALAIGSNLKALWFSFMCWELSAASEGA